MTVTAPWLLEVRSKQFAENGIEEIGIRDRVIYISVCTVSASESGKRLEVGREFYMLTRLRPLGYR